MDTTFSDTTAPWKLLSAYFGLCFVAAGSFLFNIFCPADTKSYSSAANCSAAKYNYTSDLEYAEIEKFLSGKDPENIIFEEGDRPAIRLSFDNQLEEHQRNKREKD